MTSILSNTPPTAWVGIDIAKRHNDVLVDRPGHRRRRFRVANRLDDYQRFAKFLTDLPEIPVIGFEAMGNYHRTLAFYLAEKGFSCDSSRRSLQLEPGRRSSTPGTRTTRRMPR